MRKIIKSLALILSVVMVICLAACGSSTETTADNSKATQEIEVKEGEYLYRALGDENLKNIQKNLPVKVNFYLDQGGYAKTAEITDTSEIKKIVDMFVKIKVGSQDDEFETDQYNNISFEFSDGSTCSIPLCVKKLEVGSGSNYRMYNLENIDELWQYMEANATEEDGGLSGEIVDEYHEHDGGEGAVETYDQETVEYADEIIATENEVINEEGQDNPEGIEE